MKKLLALLLSVCMLLNLSACGGAAAPTASQREAVVESVSGSARVIRGDGSSAPVAPGDRIAKGDSIVTSDGSTVGLSLDGDKTLTVSPKSEIMFDTLSENNGVQTVIVVKSGSLANSIDVKLEEGDIYEVCTGDMTMAIRGTDAYVGIGEAGTSVALLTGFAFVSNYSDGQVYRIPSGISGEFSELSSPEFETIDPETFAALSPAAAAMLEKVEKEDKDFAEDFAPLADSYLCTDSGYDFAVADRIDGMVSTAESGMTSNTGEGITSTAESSTSTTAEASTTLTTASTAAPVSQQVYITPAAAPAAAAPTAATTVATTAAPASSETTAETEPSYTWPSWTWPSETEPAETEPTETEATGTEPTETEPTETAPTETEPTEAEPTETEPAVTEPAETEPAQSEPAQAEPAQSEPAQAEPAQSEPTQAEPAQSEPAQAEPAPQTSTSTASNDNIYSNFLARLSSLSA